MSTLTEVKTLIKQQLGFYEGLSDTVIDANLNLVQAMLERPGQELPWFLFQDDATLVTVATERKVSLPADFIDFDQDWDLLLLDSDDVVIWSLTKMKSYEFSDDTTDSDQPKAFAIESDAIHLYPLPDDAYTIKFPYYAKSATLSATENHDWCKWFPDLIVAKTVLAIGAAMRDEAAVALANGMRKEAEQYFIRTVLGRKSTQLDENSDA